MNNQEPKDENENTSEIKEKPKTEQNISNESLDEGDENPKFTDFQNQITVLGKGAFGLVIEALDIENYEQIAVKIILKSRFKKDVSEKLKKEADLLRSLNHANIVQQKHLRESDTKIFIGMELLKGGGLSQVLMDKNNFISELQAAACLEAITRGMQQFHSNDIVHKDLKPENLIFGSECDQQGRRDWSDIKIVDFGLAEQFDKDPYAQTLSNTAGTLLQMSPEHTCGQGCSKSADIWALGIIMYKLLCRKHPIQKDGDSTSTYFKKLEKPDFEYHEKQGDCTCHLNDEYGKAPRDLDITKNKENCFIHKNSFDGINQMWCGFSALAKNLIKKMLEPEPENRQSAGQILRHPWTTRQEDSQIPMTLKEDQQRFEDEQRMSRWMHSLLFSSWLIENAKINNNLDASHISREESKQKRSIKRLSEPQSLGNRVNNKVIQDNTGRELNGWPGFPKPNDNYLNAKPKLANNASSNKMTSSKGFGGSGTSSTPSIRDNKSKKNDIKNIQNNK